MQPASKLPCGCEHRRSPLSGNRPQASLKAGSWLIVAPLRSKMRRASRRVPDSAEKTVRDIRRATRHHSTEKVRIVLEGLRNCDHGDLTAYD